ncbi:MAG: HAMP domain-containing histidine kinase [Chitinophagaceae bacterium]|nr:MAG: HAMP domain-containing histidine kinase [Chitinophagaceae bacterium]
MTNMSLLKPLKDFRRYIMRIGIQPAMDAQAIRKLYIFNQINFLGFLTGICLPAAAFAGNGYLPFVAWVVCFSPGVISLTVLILNHYYKHELSMFIYFTCYPLTTALVYAGNVDVGIELFFILYSVLSVFFLKSFKFISLAFMLSAICYFSVYIFHKEYEYRIENISPGFYFANHLLAIIFIFVGLILIKKESTRYQKRILGKNRKLQEIYLRVQQQKSDINSKAALLEKQTGELTALNEIKDKLFSIIAHDLRTPIYSLRNLFRNVEKYDLPGDEIKLLLPDIVKDLTYTTSLMENLLQWAKSQMAGASVNAELIDVEHMIEEVKQLLRLQAESKKVYLGSKVESGVYIFADKDMMNLVLRNLVSNAIKFTPENGEINIGAKQTTDAIQLFVEDTGTGIPEESISKLFGDDFYTTKGTHNESGTGLGLKLCKDFINKNGGKIKVHSTVGSGSTFVCSLPIP